MAGNQDLARGDGGKLKAIWGAAETGGWDREPIGARFLGILLK